MQSFIYVISTSENGPVKIGHSTAPEKRLKQLQTGHSGKLFLWHTEPVGSDIARLVEKTIHAQVGFKRLSGEWFAITTEEAVSEVRFGLMSH